MIRALILLLLILMAPAHPAFAVQSQPVAASGANLPQETAVPRPLPSGQGPPLGGPMQTEPLLIHSVTSQPLFLPGRVADPKDQLGRPAWQNPVSPPPLHADSYPPFGANLFQGRFAGTYHDGLNPGYTIMPGDRILLRIWGARTHNETLMVDPQGNIFIPEVGPLTVAGMSQSALQGAVRSHIASVFLSNVEVYASLLSAQPMGVYVTGFVPTPGRYAGGSGDSLLYYLDKAGGIIPERGSYRDITVTRNNRTVAEVDLYPFLLSGKLPSVQLQDGDVIVVGKRKDSVIAMGLIPQQAAFESKKKGMKGDELLQFVAPHPLASHVSVTGSRNSVPFHNYLPLAELAGFKLENGDRVNFLADAPGNVVLISVTGAVDGASRYPVRRATTLRKLLAHVPVDPQTANFEGIYIKRRSVAEQQRKAIQDSLYRLESSVLAASSPTAEIAAIRAQEAKLVQNFVQRVATLQPDGVVVVTRNGQAADILLEEGDEVVVPQRSDVVQITGEVIIPKSVVYDPKMSLSDYIAASGGFTERADKSHILLARQNGEIFEASGKNVQPGDLLMVMPSYDSKSFQIFKDIMVVLYQIAVATKVVVDL